MEDKSALHQGTSLASRAYQKSQGFHKNGDFSRGWRNIMHNFGGMQCVMVDHALVGVIHDHEAIRDIWLRTEVFPTIMFLIH